MAETTRAWLLTADEAVALRDAGSADELEKAVAPMRARWVAEALDQVAAGLRIRYMSTPGGRTTAQALECKEIADRMCEEADAWRDGKR